MWIFRLKMHLLTALLFAIIYAVVSMVSYSLGIGNFYFYLVFSLVMMFIQYMIGPKLVEWSMGVKYVKADEHPKLHRMVSELAAAAKIPTPRIGISKIAIPNAFAFGRTMSDGRVCVTEGITRLLNEDELKAVLGHEMSHLKNRDVLTITLLSVIPMILYRIAWQLMYFGDHRDRGQSNVAVVGLIAFLFYFITSLLVLYASRIREYFADKGSVDLGSKPADLASALYKLVYGSARTSRGEIRNVEGLKAFFVNDPSRALAELRDLKDLDLDKSGTISSGELEVLASRSIRLSVADRLLEVLSTHPNMLKRIKRLSSYA
jgi:heat shock protein HtpX